MPFCPQCRFEYRPEIAICPECHKVLVTELPPEESGVEPEEAEAGPEEPEWQELVTIYNALEYGDAALIESLLQGSDIPAVLTNEQLARTIAAPLTTGGYQVQVPLAYKERARAILEEAEHLAEQKDAPEAPQPEEMDLPEMDDDGEV